MTDCHRKRAPSMTGQLSDHINAPGADAETQADAIREARIQMQLARFYAEPLDRIDAIVVAQDILEKAGIDPALVYSLEDEEFVAKQIRVHAENAARAPGEMDGYGPSYAPSSALRAWNADKEVDA